MSAKLCIPLLLAAGACLPQGDDTSQQTEPVLQGSQMGVVSGRIYVDLANHPNLIADMANTGVRRLRIEIENPSPNNQYVSWANYRSIVSTASAYGIEVLAVITQASPCPICAGGALPDPKSGDLAWFDSTFVPDYKNAVQTAWDQLSPSGLHTIEVWNEPDVFGLTGTDGLDRYALLAVRVFEWIKTRGGSNPALVAFSLSRPDDAWQFLWDNASIASHRQYFRPQHGLPDGLPADIVGIHGYGSVTNPDSDGYKYGGGTLGTSFDSYLASTFHTSYHYGTSIFGSAPVWVTELGYPSPVVGERGQADELHSAFATLGAPRSGPQIGAVFWYDYRDDADMMGLTRGDGSAKPASAMFRQIAAGTSFQFSDLAGSPFTSYVMCLWRHGAVDGETDGSYGWNADLRRDVFTKMVIKGLGLPINTAHGPHFSDVPTTNEDYPFVETALNRGIISGYADGTFRPANSLVRAQLAKMIVSAHAWPLSNPQTPTFSDVPCSASGQHWPSCDAYPYQFVETAHAYGIIDGYADHTFHPWNNVTRGQAAKMVAANGVNCSW